MIKLPLFIELVYFFRGLKKKYSRDETIILNIGYLLIKEPGRTNQKQTRRLLKKIN
jgi:hypothetical protein